MESSSSAQICFFNSHPLLVRVVTSVFPHSPENSCQIISTPFCLSSLSLAAILSTSLSKLVSPCTPVQEILYSFPTQAVSTSFHTASNAHHGPLQALLGLQILQMLFFLIEHFSVNSTCDAPHWAPENVA